MGVRPRPRHSESLPSWLRTRHVEGAAPAVRPDGARCPLLRGPRAVAGHGTFSVICKHLAEKVTQTEGQAGAGLWQREEGHLGLAERVWAESRRARVCRRAAVE